MIDIPRYNSKLAQAIEAEGGVHTLIVTHRDDLIADHERWKKKFPTMKRVIHRTDAVAEAKDFEVSVAAIHSVVIGGDANRFNAQP